MNEFIMNVCYANFLATHLVLFSFLPTILGLDLVSRLRLLLKMMEHGEVPLTELRRNLEYAATVLENVYTDETR